MAQSRHSPQPAWEPPTPVTQKPQEAGNFGAAFVQRQPNPVEDLNGASEQGTQVDPVVEARSPQRPNLLDRLAARRPASPTPRPSLQAKAEIAFPDDTYEQDVAREAQTVRIAIQAPPPPESPPPPSSPPPAAPITPPVPPTRVMRSETALTGEGEVNEEVEDRIQSSRGHGQAIAADIRSPMEQAFSQDFSGVRIHTNTESDQLSRAVQAKAFTTGNDIYFKQGEYQPESRGGQELLAHELTHVVQQGGSTGLAVQPKPIRTSAKRTISPRDNQLSGQVQREGEKSQSSSSGKFPPVVSVSVSMNGLTFTPVKGSIFDPGDKGRQIFKMAVFCLVGASQYSPQLANQLFSQMASKIKGLKGSGAASGDAEVGEPVPKFIFNLKQSRILIDSIREKKLELKIPEERLNPLQYGVWSESAWADLQLKDVKGSLDGARLPRWYDNDLFRQEMGRQGALMRQYGQALQAYEKAYKAGSKEGIEKGLWKDALAAIMFEIEGRATLLEEIRKDKALASHSVYQGMWPSKAKTGAKPKIAPASKKPKYADNFFRFVVTDNVKNLAAYAISDAGDRRKLLDQFGEHLGRVLRLPKSEEAKDQEILDAPDTSVKANTLPFPARLTVYPKLEGSLKIEGKTDAVYNFTMDLRFGDVFEAFTNFDYVWEYMRVPDSEIQPASDKGASNSEAASSAGSKQGQPEEQPQDKSQPKQPAEPEFQDAPGVAGIEFGRQVDYAVEDVYTVFEDWGPAGVAVLGTALASRVLGFVGTGLKRIAVHLTKPFSAEEFGFETPGVYLVRCKAVPRYDQDNLPPVLRPPSVAFQPVLIQRPTRIVENRAKAQASKHQASFERMEELRQLLAEPMSHSGQEALEKELDRLERSLSSAKGAIEVELEQLRDYYKTLPEDNPQRKKVMARIESLFDVLEVRRKRGEERDLTGAEPVAAHFISDEGQEIPLRMEALHSMETFFGEDYHAYWVSDLTTPKSGEGDGLDKDPDRALVAAVVDTLRNAGYGRGYVAININDVTYTRRIKTSAKKLIFEEALENLSMAISVAAVAAAPFTGGASLALLLPAAAAGAVPSAYRVINSAIDDTLRLDLATVMDIVNIVSGGAMVGQAAAASLKLVSVGRGLMVAGLGSDGLGMLLIPVDIASQIHQLKEQGLPKGVFAAQVMLILGQAMLDAGINVGESVVRRAKGQQASMEMDGQDGSNSNQAPPQLTDGSTSQSSDSGGQSSSTKRPHQQDVDATGTDAESAGTQTTSKPPEGDQSKGSTPDSTVAGASTPKDRSDSKASTDKGSTSQTTQPTQSLAGNVASFKKALASGDLKQIAAQAEGLINSVRDFKQLRQQVSNGELGNPAQAAKALQDARMKIIDRALRRVRKQVKQEFKAKGVKLDIQFQNLGTPGFGSDCDITFKVSGAKNINDNVAASIKGSQGLYDTLRAEGLDPDKTLDANFYSDLQESKVKPKDDAEASAVVADQSVVSLAEMRMNMSDDQWQGYVKAQRDSISQDQSATGTTGEVTSTALKRMNEQIAQAEALASRLMAGDRETLLRERQQALLDALEQGASAQETRQLMAEVMLLEPDAYGTRAAVEGVVEYQQKIARGDRDTYMETNRDLPDDWAEKLAVYAQEGSASFGKLSHHTRAVKDGANYSGVRSAAKYLNRIHDALFHAGLKIKHPLLDSLNDIVKTKKGRQADAYTIYELQNSRWAEERGLTEARDKELCDAFLKEAHQLGQDMIVKMRQNEQALHAYDKSGKGADGTPPPSHDPAPSPDKPDTASPQKQPDAELPAPPAPPKKLDEGQFKVVGEPDDGSHLTAVILQDTKTGDRYFFKAVSGEQNVSRAASRGVRKGSYSKRAAAAADVAAMAGLETPDVKIVEYKGEKGSLQPWVTQGVTLKEIQYEQPEIYKQLLASPTYQKLRSDIDAFDYLINNLDRNSGNLIVDLGPDGEIRRLVPIDHDLSFPPTAERPLLEGWTRDFPAQYTHEMYGHLKQMKANPKGLRNALKPFLTEAEIDAVFKRLDAILADIETKRAQQGDEATFFPTKDVPNPSVTSAKPTQTGKASASKGSTPKTSSPDAEATTPLRGPAKAGSDANATVPGKPVKPNPDAKATAPLKGSKATDADSTVKL